MKTLIKKESSKVSKSGSTLECDVPQSKNVDGILNALDEAIKKRNENFSSMSKMEKRTEIAKDVIASLNAKKYIAERGTYLDMFDKSNPRKGQYGEDLGCRLTKDNINKETTVCHVCAIGSVFTSFAMKTKTPLSSSSDAMLRSMNSIFSKTEMRILEMLFEGHVIDDVTFDKLSKEQKKIIRQYGSQFKKASKGSADRRLRAIMNNIIDNEGKFVFGEMVLDGSF